jgi:hypothetical protein
MSKSWLLLCLIIFAMEAQSQSYLFFNSIDSNKIYTGFEANIELKLKLHNTSGNIKRYQWKRTDLCTLPSGWSAYVCDCDQCYSSTYYQSDTNGSVVDSCTVLFAYLFDFGAALGTHTAKLEITDPNNISANPNSILLSINNGCVTSTGVIRNSSMVSIFPIPAEHEITVQGLSQSDFASVELLSIYGQLIEKKKLLNGQHDIKFDLNDLSTGIYIIVLKNEHNNFMQSFKIEKR